MDEKNEVSFWKKWKRAGLRNRFDKVVASLLSLVISVIVVLSVIRLFVAFGALLTAEVNILDYKFFQTVFGMIMVVLIAMEFNHIIAQIVDKTHMFRKVRIAVAIAILAVVRKFILLDIKETSPEIIFALAAAVLALGGVYWLVRSQETPNAPSEE